MIIFFAFLFPLTISETIITSKNNLETTIPSSETTLSLNFW